MDNSSRDPQTIFDAKLIRNEAKTFILLEVPKLSYFDGRLREAVLDRYLLADLRIFLDQLSEKSFTMDQYDALKKAVMAEIQKKMGSTYFTC